MPNDYNYRNIWTVGVFKPRRLHAVGAIFGAIAFAQSAGAATVLDWTDWDATFNDGQTSGQQGFINGAGIRTRYQVSLIAGGGQPRPQYLFGTPAITADPSTSDEGLLIQHSAQPGNGTRHRFTLNQDLQGAAITVSNVDSSLADGDNHVDELQFQARLADGSIVAPTRIIGTNKAVVQAIGADTVRAIPGQTVAPNSADGSVQVFFDIADVDRIEVLFLNSTTGTISGQASEQSISFGDLVETGLILPPPIPEPGAAVMLVFGGALTALRRRR